MVQIHFPGELLPCFLLSDDTAARMLHLKIVEFHFHLLNENCKTWTHGRKSSRYKEDCRQPCLAVNIKVEERCTLLFSHQPRTRERQIFAQ